MTSTPTAMFIKYYFSRSKVHLRLHLLNLYFSRSLTISTPSASFTKPSFSGSLMTSTLTATFTKPSFSGSLMTSTPTATCALRRWLAS